MRSFFIKRKGLSPVIATIILSAVVIAVGSMVWGYAQGSASIVASNYVNDTFDLLNEVTERFTIEHVSNSSNGSILVIWVYNYGDVDVIVDVYADAYSNSNSTMNISIEAGELTSLQLNFTPSLDDGESVAIQVYSRRQNSAYYTYIVS